MSFQQGLSGLNASSKSLEVIGNNIANANTVGAKSSRAEFADVYANAIGGAANSVGIGVNVAAVAQQFTQGNITTTDNPLDLAINGDGFFQVSDGTARSRYTRNGQFKVDRTASSSTTSAAADRLPGRRAPARSSPARPRPLQLPTGGITPAVDDDDRHGDEPRRAPAMTLPAAGARSTSPTRRPTTTRPRMTVYDAKGQDVALTYYFQKAATDTWNVYVAANGTPIATDAAATRAASTTITFPANGGTPTAPVGTVAIDIPASTNAAGAPTLPITGVALDVSTAHPVRLAVRRHRPDAGRLRAGPADRRRSSRTTASSWRATRTASPSRPGRSRSRPSATRRACSRSAATPGRAPSPRATRSSACRATATSASLQAGALEESNVDLTGELVNMITAQRVYQANAQTIKTQDQMLQTLVNLR